MSEGADGNVLDTNEDRKGWYKLMIPVLNEVFSDMWADTSPPHDYLPFIYGKLDPEQIAFNIKLSTPMYAVDKVCFVEVDRPKKVTKGVAVSVISLAAISAEHTCRCYIATALVSWIIPVNPKHQLVDAMIAANIMSSLVVPTIQETGKVLNLPKILGEESG